MPPYQLAINTSQSNAQIAIFQDNVFIGEKLWTKANSHSEVITLNFKQLLKEQNIDLSQINKIYCVNGPGSFTGIRVGVTFCKALAYSLSCPMVAINTLDLLALNCDQIDARIIACINAQKNSIFLSEFEYTGKKWVALRSNVVLKVSTLPQEITQRTYVCGDGLEHYRNFIDKKVLEKIIANPKWQVCDFKNYFSAHHFLFSRKEVPWNNLQPVYVKASTAEEKLKLSNS